MKRQSSRSIIINPNLRCLKVYPLTGTKKNIQNLKTIGLKLTKEQGINLARVILAVTQEWNEIDITAFRLNRRKADNTYKITVTGLDG